MARLKTGGRRRVALIATLTTVVLSAGIVLWVWAKGAYAGVTTLWISVAVVVVGLLSLLLLNATRRGGEPAERKADAGARQPQGAAWLAAFAQVITAIATLLSTGAAGYVARGVQQPAVTVTVTAAPSAHQPATTPAARTTSAPVTTALAVPQCAASVDVTAPQAQPGYDLVWQGCTAIDPAGVVFDTDGPHKANGVDFTVAYQPDAGGWRAALVPFIRWKAPGRPGPSTCQAEFSAGNRVDAEGNRTAVGRAYCLRTSGTDSGGPYHVYMQVYDVTASRIRVALWEWRDHR